MVMFYRLCDWVGKLTGTIIFTPHTYVVGNCAEDIYYGLIQARREHKKLIILYPYELPWRLKFGLPNIELVNIESEYRFPLNKSLYIVGRILITAYFAFFRSLSLLVRLLSGHHLNDLYRTPRIGALTLWQPEEKMASFSWDVVDKYDWRKQLETPLQVSLGKQKKTIAENLRVRMGLPKDTWFACLHVRESGFRDSASFKENDSYSERNANILNYIGAIKEITSRGGWVIRMGDATMTKLPVMERVIDYPFTEQKSALMDVYLISECRVYIGMMSGIYDVARLFQRPMIMTNMNNWMFTFPIKRGDLGVMKHIYSKSKKRFLTVREWLLEPWAAVSYAHKLGVDYVFYENTPDELRSVVKEFFDRGDEWEPSPLQRQFAELRLHQGREIIGDVMFTANDVYSYYHKSIVNFDLTERYRLASRLDSAIGMLGTEFLQQNWAFDVTDEKLAERWMSQH